MPKQGFTVITIKQQIYDKIKKHMEEANRIAGYEKYRSAAQYVEACVASFEGTGEMPLEARTVTKPSRKSGKK